MSYAAAGRSSTQSNGSGNHHQQQHQQPRSSPEDAAATALRGASLAFSKTQHPDLSPASSSPSPSSNNHNHNHTHITADGHPIRLFRHSRQSSNEALTAATSAGRARSPGRIIATQATGGSTAVDAESHNASLVAAGVVATRLQQLGIPNLVPSAPSRVEGVHRIDAKSPSFIAATLAASRSVSPNAALSRRALKSHQDVEVDAAPIPPTNSLISMFEKAADDAPVTTVKKNRVPLSAVALPKVPASKSRRSLSPPKTTAQKEVSPKRTPAKSPVRRTAAVAAEKLVKTPTKPKHLSQPKAEPAKPKPETALPPKPKTDALPLKPKIEPLPAKPKVDPLPPKTRVDPLPPKPKTPDAKPKPTMPAKQLPPPIKLTPKLRRPSPSPPKLISQSTPDVLSPKPTRVAKASLRSPSPPSIVLRPSEDVKSPPEPQKRRSPESKAAPTPPQPRRSQRFVKDRSRSRPRGNSELQPTKPAVISMYGLPLPGKSTTPSVTSSPSPLPPTSRDSIASAPPSPTHEAPLRRRLPSNAHPPPMELKALTNAMMAGSLAVSRLTPQNSGSSMPPTLPKRQKSPRLLQTLRRPPSSDDEESEWQRKLLHHHHHHRNKLHTSRHMLHEGSRKRWRDKITERERKRYEAVWASNRGVLLVPSGDYDYGYNDERLTDCVANVVVREIWRRSRLPDDDLAATWELVDKEARGYLSRDEFVVGMWLVDQQLRGRKLPLRVSDSIWDSAFGVKLRNPRK